MKCQEIVERARREGRRVLLLHEAYELLACYGLPVPRWRLARSPEEAAEAAEELGAPLALKIVSPDVLHKSDVGGVALGVRGPREAAEAYRRIVENVERAKPGARIVGVLVQEMVPQGLEVLVGGVRDQVFGPLVAFGLGGVLVELYEDIAFRVAPIHRVDAVDMIREVRASKLLEGYRGMPPRDVDTLIDILVRVSRLMAEAPIAELDINPLMLYERGGGAKIADARILLVDAGSHGAG